MLARSLVTLLLVEDHLALREIITEALCDYGYPVAAYESAEGALASPDAAAAHIALLDLNLPGEDGLYVAQQLRLNNPHVGIIMLTVRNQLADKLEGYAAGADIYLPKPVTPQELDAAIQALCRRMPSPRQAGLTLHHATQQLTNAQQTCVQLSADECRLLILLAQAPQSKLEYWELAERLNLDLESDNLRTILEKRISRLRRKFIQLNQPFSGLKALRGYGYQLTCTIQIL